VTPPAATAASESGTGSLFEAVPGAYAFLRERLFRDDTDLIAAALWAGGAPPAGALALEVGCGPGHYARRLARRFPELHVLGVDRAEALLARARDRAAAEGLANCRFERGDAGALPPGEGMVDAVLAPRLFTVLTEPERALAEMHRVLRPGGRCFLAEPRSGVRAAVPLLALRLLAGVARRPAGAAGAFAEPRLPAIMTLTQLRTLVGSRPWVRADVWQDGHYRYAVCEKPPPAPPDSRWSDPQGR
jgi:SAM-dependent methyltransferase